ncbi:hypothetical protein IE81DRAFT_326004 [Ceraceosorus guamensis]|uniref:TAF6 C-terminal HEAT repeat domain-containing protein n=1 Tax=Ceraceosorus guamensis TaxID=1522189 RepID=A0A316VQT5_9BASI|nr:hypothetical protein IE81DRAFT_326004 [Ceraceosorus guamensis]PWN39956.1 hypothetical protein IE81DRAFT_326004 [Ceraceosorus guamensis]
MGADRLQFCEPLLQFALLMLFSRPLCHLRLLRGQPLYGHYSQPRGHSSLIAPAVPVYKRVQTTSGPQYVLDDPEISLEDISSLIRRQAPLQRSQGVGWAAHWLAVEGVQPDIPQNPDRGKTGHLPLEEDAKTFNAHHQQSGSNGTAAVNGVGRALGAVGPSTLASASGSTLAGSSSAAATLSAPQVRPLIKHVLSRELQLYFTRLTDAIMSSPLPAALDGASGSAQDEPASSAGDDAVDNPTRSAALSSLAGDAGLAQLLPYLIQWIGERIVDLVSASSETSGDAQRQIQSAQQSATEAEGRQVECQRALVAILGAIEAVLRNSTLLLEPYLHQLLPSILSVLLTSLLPSCLLLRARAASLLRLLLTNYNKSYPSLKPRLIRTLSKCAVLEISGQERRIGHPIVTVQGALLGIEACGEACIKNVLLRSGLDKVEGNKVEERTGLEERGTDETSLLGKIGLGLQSRPGHDRKSALGVVVQILVPLSPSYTSPLSDPERSDLRQSVRSRHGQFFADVFASSEENLESMEVDGNADDGTFIEKSVRTRIARVLAGPATT